MRAARRAQAPHSASKISLKNLPAPDRPASLVTALVYPTESRSHLYHHHTMLQPDTLLHHRYRILRLIGRGGMGAVYAAEDTQSQTTVALKACLAPAADHELRRAFRAEARVLARLAHPALPRYLDEFAEGDSAYLVMEHIAGDDLATQLARRRGQPFPVAEVLRWADELRVPALAVAARGAGMRRRGYSL